MSIFDHLDYRDFLKAYIENQPKKGWGVVSKIAEALDMTQAHVSQILSGAKEFSAEQALKLSRFLQLSNFESDYLILLIQFQRAGTQDLKDYYKEKIDKTKLEALQVKNHFSGFAPLSESEMNQFYSTWLYSAIRMFCSVGNGKSFQDILSRFPIAPKELTAMVGFMTDKGLLTREGNHYQLGSQRTLSQKGSPQFVMHSKNWRLQAVQRCERLNEGDIFITSPMSMSKEDYEKLRNDLIELLKKISLQVADSPAEEIVCLNLDLFLI